ETLVRAQAASGADVVTCGQQLGSDTQQFFLGEPGGLGVVSNTYGQAALIRRSLLSDDVSQLTAGGDQDWPLFARLALTGAEILSVPQTLIERRHRPDDLERHTADALIVLQEFERQLPRPLRS